MQLSISDPRHFLPSGSFFEDFVFPWTKARITSCPATVFWRIGFRCAAFVLKRVRLAGWDSRNSAVNRDPRDWVERKRVWRSVGRTKAEGSCSFGEYPLHIGERDASKALDRKSFSEL